MVLAHPIRQRNGFHWFVRLPLRDEFVNWIPTEYLRIR